MYVKRSFSPLAIMRFSGGHLLWIGSWAAVPIIIHMLTGWEWMHLPWLPISVIGTAVAFYVGFKNNSVYDRMWEARKIWGGIVNDSRSWGAMVMNFVSDQFVNDRISDQEFKQIKERLIYRHVAWLYKLRSQLLRPAPWEHENSSSKHIAGHALKRKERYGLGLLKEIDKPVEEFLKGLLDPQELTQILDYKNGATQLIEHQARDLKELRKKDLIDDFRHMEMQQLLTNFYTLQGKCERIKNYPLPRQYANTSQIFIGLFILLLPFGMMMEFEKMGEGLIWLTVPFCMIVGWVFVMMELVGDYSENPFEG
ncbi:MAG: bestrophin family protein, partial [Flavobacteriales bacterium]|nr:bestrophin family protein [Flavobacteriales bacterium]